MSIRDMIQDCKMCPLFSNMQISPIAPEIFGENPKVLFVCGLLPNKENDVSQEVLMGANRVILQKLCKELSINYAITLLIKCANNVSYKKNDFKTCSTHVPREYSALGVKRIIGFGKNVQNYVHCDHYFESINIVLNNKKKLTQLKVCLEKVKNDFPQ